MTTMQPPPPPLGLTYDPFAITIHNDPYPTYAWMRSHAPLYRNPALNFWALSRYDDVRAALRDWQRFSNRNGISLEPDLWSPQAAETSSFLAMDPPEHGKFRRLLGKRFKPGWTAGVEHHVRAVTRRLLEPLVEQGDFDFAADFASVLPHEIMCDIVGIPTDDRDMLRHANDLLNDAAVGAADQCPVSSNTRSEETRSAGMQLGMYYLELIQTKRRNPDDRMLTEVLQTRIDGTALTDRQVVAFLFLMVSATNESTGKAIGNAWYHGWLHPDVRQRGLNGAAVAWADETLRYDSPSQMVARILTEDVRMYDTVLPAGSRVALLPASANRDASKFPDPDVFNLDRDTHGSIAFGNGPHVCPGASLARLEMACALETAAELLADYEIDLGRARRVHSPHQRGFSRLPCTVQARH